ncbi:MAG: hypothetical protein RPR91_09070, partial [Colwellia sp.]
EEALEQHHFIVAVIHNGITIISSQRLELKLLKHSETCILIGDGYILEKRYGFSKDTGFLRLFSREYRKR